MKICELCAVDFTICAEGPMLAPLCAEGFRFETIPSARYRLCRCAISRLGKEKGFAKLFEAKRHVVAKLWVIGERLLSDHAGALARLLKVIADDHELAGKISLLGLAPRPLMAER